MNDDEEAVLKIHDDVLRLDMDASTRVKLTTTTTESSGQVTPWGDHSRIALLNTSQDLESSDIKNGKNNKPILPFTLFESIKPVDAASVPNFWRRRWHGSVHFYFKYIHVLSAVMAGLIFVLFILVLILGTLYYRVYAERHARPRSVIFMLADGFGPASQTLARAVHMSQLPETVQDRYLPGLAPLPLDDMLRGMIRTSSRNSLVTDSAAGATAYACGRKSDNGVYGASHKRHYGTLLEAAKLRGMRTGVVVTSSVTHATPAAFTAHGLNREDENEIATWQMSGAPLDRPGEPMVDLLLGGGLCRFLPTNTTRAGVNSCRVDKLNLLDAAQSRFGYTLATNRAALDEIISGVSKSSGTKKTLPVLGLFSAEHMAYEIERDSSREPSLSEMLRAALSLLGPHHSDTGFFLFVEGSKIDMAAHENDAPTHAIEVLEYNRAVQVAKDWVHQHPDTLLISVADHETGGLSLGRRNEPNYWIYAYPYRYMPLSFADIRRSALSVARQLVRQAQILKLCAKNAFTPEMAKSRSRLMDIIRETIKDVYKVTPLDVTLDKAYFIVTMHDQAPKYVDENHFRVARVIGEAVAIQAGIAWSTPGHTGVDICLYGIGAGAAHLNSCMENTDVHYVVKDLLNLDTDAVSDLLLNSMPPPLSTNSTPYSGNLGGARS